MTHQRNKSIKESMKIFDQYFEVNYFLFYLILSDLQWLLKTKKFYSIRYDEIYLKIQLDWINSYFVEIAYIAQRFEIILNDFDSSFRNCILKVAGYFLYFSYTCQRIECIYQKLSKKKIYYFILKNEYLFYISSIYKRNDISGILRSWLNTKVWYDLFYYQ